MWDSSYPFPRTGFAALRCAWMGALVACIASLPYQSANAVDADSQARIIGGKKTNDCGWRSVVGFGFCSGVLVHPRVVLSAAHCGLDERAKTITIGNDIQNAERSVRVQECVSYPGFNQNFGSGVDWAYCILEEAVYDVPIVPVLSECERDRWERYARSDTTVLVGFGRDESGQSGQKRSVRVPVQELIGDEIKVGGNGQAGCFGDSGGPAFIQLPDQTWRTMGIISYARGTCGSPEYLVSIAASLSWLEDELEQYGLDITPCTNPLGKWVGGPRCSDFPTAPDTMSCNSKDQVGGRFESCEDPFLGIHTEFPLTGLSFPTDESLEQSPHHTRDDFAESGCSVSNTQPTTALSFAMLMLLIPGARPRQRS